MFFLISKNGKRREICFLRTTTTTSMYTTCCFLYNTGWEKAENASPLHASQELEFSSRGAARYLSSFCRGRTSHTQSAWVGLTFTGCVPPHCCCGGVFSPPSSVCDCCLKYSSTENCEWHQVPCFLPLLYCGDVVWRESERTRVQKVYNAKRLGVGVVAYRVRPQCRGHRLKQTAPQ